MCRIIYRVSREIAKNKKHFIKFPLGEESQLIKQTFRFSNEIPGVVGCIDCSHIPIISPGGENAELYRNRKGYFSLNVQAVCDIKLMFTNIVCRWPGSTHDSRIFDISALCSQFRNGLIDGILLGDGGYPCRHYLMTPVINPTTSKERRYNRAHIATRETVERMFGLWKSRFRCISIPLRTSLKNTLVILVATACLHNFAQNKGDFIEFESSVTEINEEIAVSRNNSVAGNVARQQIIDNFF